jgi:hypothetical protein
MLPSTKAGCAQGWSSSAYRSHCAVDSGAWTSLGAMYWLVPTGLLVEVMHQCAGWRRAGDCPSEHRHTAATSVDH